MLVRLAEGLLIGGAARAMSRSCLHPSGSRQYG